MKSLTELANFYRTDKGSTFGCSHNYTENYDKIMSPLRDKNVNILEIGVLHGNSIRMWSDYFSNGFIYGIDTFPLNRFEKKFWDQGLIKKDIKYREFKNEGVKEVGEYYANELQNTLDPKKCKVNFCSQAYIDDDNFEDHSNTDRVFEKFIGLKSFTKEISPIEFDFILDDGSHKQEDHQISFGFLFDYLKRGGTYFIEDVRGGKHHAALVSHFKKKAYSTIDIFKKFQNTGDLESNYIDKNKTEEIKKNIYSCEIFNNGNLIAIKKS
jgi:hypothetical protein